MIGELLMNSPHGPYNQSILFCRQFELTILSRSGVFYKSGQKDIYLGSSFAIYEAIWNGRRVGIAFFLKVFQPGRVGKDKDSFCRLNNESKLRF